MVMIMKNPKVGIMKILTALKFSEHEIELLTKAGLATEFASNEIKFTANGKTLSVGMLPQTGMAIAAGNITGATLIKVKSQVTQALSTLLPNVMAVKQTSPILAPVETTHGIKVEDDGNGGLVVKAEWQKVGLALDAEGHLFDEYAPPNKSNKGKSTGLGNHAFDVAGDEDDGPKPTAKAGDFFNALAELEALPLGAATKWLQPVKGTSSGSIYFLIGLTASGATKVAARYKNNALSLRIEGLLSTEQRQRLYHVGMKDNQDYVSGHWYGLADDAAVMTMGAVMALIGMQTHVPEIKQILVT